MKEEIYQMYLDLLEYCSQMDTFDKLTFKRNSDKYAKMYQRLSYEEQGWIAEQLCLSQSKINM